MQRRNNNLATFGSRMIQMDERKRQSILLLGWNCPAFTSVLPYHSVLYSSKVKTRDQYGTHHVLDCHILNAVSIEALNSESAGLR